MYVRGITLEVILSKTARQNEKGRLNRGRGNIY